MADRVCRAVGLDVHGVFVERYVNGVTAWNPEAVVRAGQERAASCYRQALNGELGPFVTFDVDPQLL